MKTALIIYYSSTGNTEKAAQAIRMGFEEAGVQVTMKKPHRISQFGRYLHRGQVPRSAMPAVALLFSSLLFLNRYLIKVAS